MPWNDARELEAQLNKAVTEFNWSRAEEICKGITDRINKDPDQFPERSAKALMTTLRRKRRFKLMTQLAEALLQSGLKTPQIRRQYAQALIDQGVLAAGEMVLQTIIQDPMGIKGEELEARGLTGRIYKQMYVNNNDPKSQRNRDNLERALKEYLYVYRLAPQDSLWHGINVVALSDRARRDRLPLAGLPDVRVLAEEILATLDEKDRQSTDDLPAYDIATELEAYVALGRDQNAIETALGYVEKRDADAFEINSTFRQLTEVWQLNYEQPPGNHLLPILKSGHLRKEGAAVGGDPQKMMEEAANVAEALEDLEGIYGSDRMVTLNWYKLGLNQCNSVARIQRLDGNGKGTGWLVNAGDFFQRRQGILLLTNAHVVSNDRSVVSSTRALYPSDAKANFMALDDNGILCELEKEVVWTSPPADLDATFLSVKGDLPAEAKPLALHDRAVEMGDPVPRLYIIGHPEGRGTEISLQDNYLLGCNEKLLHYRTPTEPGSSGSPVFEHEGWRVVGLHHRGSKKMKRLDNPNQTYEANEGIAIKALQARTRG